MVTWDIDSIEFANRARRIIRCVATRTENGQSRTYSVRQFHVNVREGVTLADEFARLVRQLKKLASDDASWGVPDFDVAFPNAAVVLKNALEAEVV